MRWNNFVLWRGIQRMTPIRSYPTIEFDAGQSPWRRASRRSPHLRLDTLSYRKGLRSGAANGALQRTSKYPVAGKGTWRCRQLAGKASSRQSSASGDNHSVIVADGIPHRFHKRAASGQRT